MIHMLKLLTLSTAPAEIIHPPESIGIDIEGNGSLPCQAIGKPQPKLMWRRGDGKPLDIGGRFSHLPSGSLQISSESAK